MPSVTDNTTPPADHEAWWANISAVLLENAAGTSRDQPDNSRGHDTWWGGRYGPNVPFAQTHMPQQLDNMFAPSDTPQSNVMHESGSDTEFPFRHLCREAFPFPFNDGCDRPPPSNASTPEFSRSVKDRNDATEPPQTDPADRVQYIPSPDLVESAFPFERYHEWWAVEPQSPRLDTASNFRMPSIRSAVSSADDPLCTRGLPRDEALYNSWWADFEVPPFLHYFCETPRRRRPREAPIPFDELIDCWSNMAAVVISDGTAGVCGTASNDQAASRHGTAPSDDGSTCGVRADVTSAASVLQEPVSPSGAGSDVVAPAGNMAGRCRCRRPGRQDGCRCFPDCTCPML